MVSWLPNGNNFPRMHTWANIEKAKELLGWQPETGFETGMSQTVDWYQNKAWLSEIKF